VNQRATTSVPGGVNLDDFHQRMTHVKTREGDDVVDSSGPVPRRVQLSVQ
jgi:hypothetical protein